MSNNMTNSSMSDFEIITSPSMIEKMEKLELRFEKFENLLESINQRLQEDYNEFSNNKNEYLKMFKKIEEISATNKNILQENRKIYTSALDKLQNTTGKNFKELKPLLDKMYQNTNQLDEDILQDINLSRQSYRNWRVQNNNPLFTTYNSMLPGLLGMPFISSYNKSMNLDKSTTINLD